MFYLMMRSTDLIYGYMASGIWYRTTQIVRGEKLAVATSWALFLISSKGSFLCTVPQTYHGLCYTSCEALVGKKNSSSYPPWGIDLKTHCTMSGCSTTDLHLAFCVTGSMQYFKSNFFLTFNKWSELLSPGVTACWEMGSLEQSPLPSDRHHRDKPWRLEGVLRLPGQKWPPLSYCDALLPGQHNIPPGEIPR